MRKVRTKKQRRKGKILINELLWMLDNVDNHEWNVAEE